MTTGFLTRTQYGVNENPFLSGAKSTLVCVACVYFDDILGRRLSAWEALYSRIKDGRGKAFMSKRTDCAARLHLSRASVGSLSLRISLDFHFVTSCFSPGTDRSPIMLGGFKFQVQRVNDDAAA